MSGVAVDRDLERVEVRPVVTRPTPEVEAAARQWISARIASRSLVARGDVFTAGGQEFAIVSSVPTSKGFVSAATEVSMPSGPPVPALERVQLTYLNCAGDPDDQNHAFYDQYIRPLLLRWKEGRSRDNGHYFAVLIQDTVVVASDAEFGVRALDPVGRCGAIDEKTMVFISYVESPCLQRVHVLPYEDTLPTAYSTSLFRDLLQPFFQAHPFATYAEGDLFTYLGVRFRVMATDPPGVAARIGSSTMVYFEGEPLRQTIIDLMPPELRADLGRLPRGLQALLLNTIVNEEAVRGRLTEINEVLRRGRGVDARDLEACGRVCKWSERQNRDDAQEQCMVCLCDFEDDDTVRELPCSHVFHQACIDEWLQRSASCPICKRPLLETAPESQNSTSAPSSAPRRASLGGGGSGGPRLLVGSRVVCPGGVSGTVVGYEAAAQKFRVSVEGNPEEQEFPIADVVQQLIVCLTGLQTADLNGKSAEVIGFDAGRERYRVRLPAQESSGLSWIFGAGTSERVVAVRPDNCILSDGAVVRVVGLRASPHGARWNGHYGRVVGYDRPRARHVLAMQGPRGQLLSVKPKNLRL